MTPDEIQNKSIHYNANPQNKRLLTKAIGNTLIKQPYTDKVCELMDDFTSEKLDPKAGSLANNIKGCHLPPAAPLI